LEGLKEKIKGVLRMKYIKFYGTNINSMTADRITNIYMDIQSEIESYKRQENKYPMQVHVYIGKVENSSKAFLNMMNSNHPKSHLTIAL